MIIIYFRRFLLKVWFNAYDDEIKLNIFDKLNFKRTDIDEIKYQFLINFKQIFQYTFTFALEDKDI